MSRGTRGSRWWWSVATLLGALAATACSGSDGGTIDVFAASSMTSALTEIVDVYEAAHPEVDVRITFAGSSTLREQLRDGAEVDLFISANTEIVDSLVADGTIPDAGEVIATNVLVLAIPKGNPAGVTGLADLADEDLFVGICAQGVPCGDLARQLLTAAGVEVAADTEAPDVRSLALRLAEGELDAALVYLSDVVALFDDLDVVDLDVTVSNRYPLVTLTDDAEVRDFAGFVAGSNGQKVLADSGFGLQ